MTQDLPEKPAETHPSNGRASDSKAPMNDVPHEFRFELRDLRDPHAVAEALTHWDELDAGTLARLAAHPVHGPRLAMLRAAEDWLRDRGAAARAARGLCPTAEELYDFGRGPGYTPLSHAARTAIDRHLAQCEDCEVLVESLVAPPPAPLEYDFDEAAHANLLDTPTNGVHTPNVRGVAASNERDHSRDDALTNLGAAPSLASPTSVRTIHPAAPAIRRRRHWIPLAAAASFLAAGALWIALNSEHTRALHFPTSPLLRGAARGSLLFPRDRVLHATPELVKIFPALAAPPTFEIQPEPNAERYWIDVSKNDGSAFATNEALWRQTSATPMFASEHEIASGHYTWEAWAIVRGIDQHLGSHDFEIVDDAALTAKLVALANEPEPERSLAAVNLLHASDYRTDARRIARAMPPTPERDAYLDQVPGR